MSDAIESTASEPRREELSLKRLELDLSRFRIENEIKLKNYELDLQNEELKIKKIDEARSRFTNPLFLAVVAATITGIGNIYVAVTNNNTNLDLEVAKEAQEKLVESRKAEFARLLEVSKLDVDTAKKRLCFLADTLMISDTGIRQRLSSTYCRGEDPAVKAKVIDTVAYESGWLGGGHNQDEACAQGIASLQASYPGKRLAKLSSGEDVRKEFWGHVEYKYHCIISIAENP